MSNKVLALSGHMGSGKDTAAAMIIDAYPGAKAYAFADHLKKIALDIFLCTEQEIYGEEKEKPFKDKRFFGHTEADMVFAWVSVKNDKYNNLEILNNSHRLAESKEWILETPRALLQFLGTELLRDCYSKSYHIDQVAKRIKDDQPVIAVITDARFPNERTWAKEYGAKTLLITGRTRNDFTKENFSKHASETSLGYAEDYDFVIDNSGTLEDLSKNIFEVVDAL